MTPHELAAPAIEEAVTRPPTWITPTPQIPVEAIVAAIRDLEEDWFIDVDHDLEAGRVVVMRVEERPGSRAPWLLMD